MQFTGVWNIHKVVQPWSPLSDYRTFSSRMKHISMRSHSPFPPPSSPWQPLICFLQICLFWTFHISRIIQYMAFCVWLWPYGLQPTRLLCPWDSPGKNTGVGCYSSLQEIFHTRGWNPHLLLRSVSCTGRQVLYHRHHLGSTLSLSIVFSMFMIQQVSILYTFLMTE